MPKNKSELIYLACPYTHQDHYVMVERFYAVNYFAAKLMAQGKYVFSPISHTHPIAEASKGTLPRGWDFWQGYDQRMLSCCNRLIVLRLEGWFESTGVQAEIKIANEMGIPVEFIDPSEYHEWKDGNRQYYKDKMSTAQEDFNSFFASDT